MDKVINDARVYTDIQGLENLRYSKNTGAAKKEISHQFESMLMQIVMRSMREANNALSSDLFGSSSDEMDYYQDMFDKQLSMMTSPSGNSFAQMVEKNIDMQYPGVKIAADAQAAATKQTPPTVLNPKMNSAAKIIPAPGPALIPNTIAPAQIATSPVVTKAPTEENIFQGPEDFVKKLWASAKTAATALGTDPRILIAQAALETNWGKKVLPYDKNNSTHNLFNIKADASWNKQTTTMSTLEQQDGVIAKVKATFRSYASYAESFKDYANFLKQNNRYSEALSKATDPQQFVNALQKAGFATDANYADKILKIFSSDVFKKITGDMSHGI